MTRDYQFYYTSDAAAEIIGCDCTVNVLVTLEVALSKGHNYDTPFGPSPTYTNIDNIKIIDITLASGRFLRITPGLRAEITKAIERERPKIIEEFYSEV